MAIPRSWAITPYSRFALILVRYFIVECERVQPIHNGEPNALYKSSSLGVDASVQRERSPSALTLGYQSEATLKELERLGISYTMAVRANAKGIKSLVEAIDSDS